MILVDSSIWIELLNGSSHRSAEELEEIIHTTPTNLAICDIIMAEVLQGIRNDDVFEEIKWFLYPYLVSTPSSPETHAGAAMLYRTCKHHGVTIRSLADAIIATTALDLHAPLWSLDRDFQQIAQYFPLMLYKPA